MSGFDMAFEFDKMLSEPHPQKDIKVIIFNYFVYFTWSDVKHRVVKHIFNSNKKGSHCSFMQLKNRESLCEMPRVVKMNHGINKMVFNRNLVFHLTFILGNIPKIANADIKSLQSNE